MEKISEEKYTLVDIQQTGNEHIDEESNEERKHLRGKQYIHCVDNEGGDFFQEKICGRKKGKTVQTT